VTERQYREKLYRSYSKTFGEQKSDAQAPQWAQYEAIYRTLPVGRDATIVDLGCGKGEWVRWLASKGFRDVVGVDGAADDLAMAGAHGQGRFLQADALEHLAGMATASADLVHLKDVVEHLTRDELLQMLEEAHRVLRPGGELWVLTFNAQSPLASSTRYGDFTHELGLTPSSMSQAMRAAGFRTIEITGYHYCAATPGGALRRMLGTLFYALARVVLRLRHGDGTRSPGIDTFTALPDFFAVATRE
jgi:SAM-dependent methyltransferase